MDAYSRYLQSKHWKAFRFLALEHCGNKCSLCGSTDNLTVHHKHYETIGDEKFDDVEVLCRQCHKLRENNSGYITIDIEIVKKIDAKSLQLYLLMKSNMFLNKQDYCEISYEAIGKIMGCSIRSCSFVKDLIEKYHLLRREHTKTVNRYYLTHPDNWTL